MSGKTTWQGLLQLGLSPYHPADFNLQRVPYWHQSPECLKVGNPVPAAVGTIP